MKEKRIDKWFHSISYKQYLQMRNTSLVTLEFFCLLEIVMNFMKSNLQLPISMYSINSIISTYLLCSNKQYSTKDMMEIKKLYQDFLNQYKKLNEKLKFSNPIEISTLHTLLVYSGYLSKNQNFQVYNDKSDFSELLGVNIFKGYGVCRNISSMLTDLLRTRGYLAHDVSVYSKSEEEEKHPIKLAMSKTSGNHRITYVEKDEINYFLDPTNYSFYQLDRMKKHRIYNSLDELLIKKIELKGLKNRINIYKKMSTNKDISEEETNKIKKETLKKINGNLGLLKEFYEDNKELLMEAGYKVENIQKIKSKYSII